MENKKVILVVEDNPLNMKLAADLLEFNGFEVMKAIDGQGALDVLEKTVPDLIILDIQLPDMSGFEVFKRIRENEKFGTAKIIALTAQVMKEEQENIKNTGFDDYIMKPFDIKNFIKKVKDIVACEQVDR